MKFEGIHEKTLVIIKPDAIQRGLLGEIISRFEKKGLKIVGLKMMRLDDAVLREHYAHIACDSCLAKDCLKGLDSVPRRCLVRRSVMLV